MTTLTRQRTESISLILPFILISQLLVSSERFTSWLYWKLLSVNRSRSSIRSVRARDLEIVFDQRQSLYSWNTDVRKRAYLIWICNWERILSWALVRSRRRKIRISSTVISTDDIGSSSVSSRSLRRIWWIDKEKMKFLRKNPFRCQEEILDERLPVRWLWQVHQELHR